jgi:hypothetical protein
MMSLKLRRNLPLVLLLLALLAFLAVVWGDLPIVAYTAETDSQQAEAPATLDIDLTNGDGGTAGLLETADAAAGALEQAMIQDE